MYRMSRKNNKKMRISIKFTNFDKTADMSGRCSTGIEGSP